MKYLVAVSGGVDSVVLLDMLVSEGMNELIVAHFDHGIRDNSAEDAAFVRGLAKQYGLPFESQREELGKDASEEKARTRRYRFLREVAKKHNATLVTAHHADDVVETVAINLIRGTGWRGVAVLNAPDIERPLLELPKQALLTYAKAHHLQWCEDTTNNDLKYLRNEIRSRLGAVSFETKLWVREYRRRQIELVSEIDAEAARLLGNSPYSRYFFTYINESAAVELLGLLLRQEVGASPMVSHRLRLLHAIKVAKPGATYDVGGGARLRFTRTKFIVEQPR